MSRPFIQTNPFTTEHMCLKSGPEFLQSTCVFYPYNFHLVEELVCRIEELRKEIRGTVPYRVLGAQPSNATAFIQVSHLLTWTKYIPRLLERCIWKASPTSNFFSPCLLHAEVHSCFCHVTPLLQICWVRTLTSCNGNPRPLT